ncbi:GNAT family N-acetyltransferase [Actinoplanes sp. NBC_00393]|uniref:GNAT family N-acetyltransferase n=1 Tax=Actinoplanes sp. NBC_00393 TaxID=2975953 RepID=UPI002E251E47
MYAITAVTAGRLRSLQDQLLPVYQQCFSGPPWNETPEQIAGYPQRLAGQTTNPAAYGVVAYREGELAGAVYGWPAPALLPADNEFDRALRDAVTPQVAALLVAPAVVVAELMVAPAHRGQGLGRKLLTRYVAGHPRAWLVAHPDAAAVRLYESTGWTRQAAYTVAGEPCVLYAR